MSKMPKFRAWYDNKMWCLAKLDLWGDPDQAICDLAPYMSKYEELYDIYLSDVILMQSTGLFSTFSEDELFEDDVIFWTYFDEFEDMGKARIVHRDGCWKLLDVKTGKEAWDSLFDCLENCTVFLSGNIYENPELGVDIND